MDWVADFCTRQDEPGGVYSGGVTDERRAQVTAIARLAGPGPKRFLELGGGGGQSVAAANLGHAVVAVELVPAAAHARSLAAARPEGRLTVVEGHFCAVEPKGPFDVVRDGDGFGVGGDADQRRLPRRVAAWPDRGGRALLDVDTPWYRAPAAGREIWWQAAARR
jgi:hypothetical protein